MTRRIADSDKSQVETMRALAHGGPIAWPLEMTVAWAVVLVAVFIPVAVRGYRLAAEASA